MSETNPIGSRRVQRALLVGSALFGVLACVTRWGHPRNDAPPHGWWAERGPVVPHETFPSECSLCHAGQDWHSIREDFVFDHALETGVELEGAHRAAECLRCHNDRGPVATFANQGCAGCHEDVHRGLLGRDCSLCHDEETWKPGGEIALHDRTRFPLVGSHAAVACWRCHAGAEVGNFSPVDVECVSCHAADLARATDPDHVALGFVDSCDRCHIPTTWVGAGFNHPGFALTGAHASADCEACHTGATFGGLPRDCYSCHTTEYNGAPEHLSGSYPTSCELCHNTNTWEGARFNHTGITSGCEACHLDDYNATNDPDHAAAGFPTTCEICHNTNRWQGAVFNHSFPITSGAHKVLDCADCHTAAPSYNQFSCIDCHEHRQSEMDPKHHEVMGYVYESNACLACHPSGRS